MSKYKVEVPIVRTVYVTVEANGEMDAIDLAKRLAVRENYGTRALDNGAKVVFIAKKGFPAIRVPTDWEIYWSMKGADKVNAIITERATRLGEHLVMLHKQKRLGRGAIMDAVVKFITPIYFKYNKFGTGDSEPRDQMAEFVASWAKALDSTLDKKAIFDIVAGLV